MGSLREEYTAAAEGAVFFRLSDRSSLVVGGADARKFLDQVLSAKVDSLAEGSGCYAGLLEPKGKYISEMIVFCLGELFLLDCPAEARERVQATLNSYRFRAKVRIVEQAADSVVVSLQGARAAELLPEAGLSQELGIITGGPDGPWMWAGRVSESPFGGLRLWTTAQSEERLEQMLLEQGAVAGSSETLRLLRILSGTPSWRVDFDETTLPPEAGQDRALSYDKCYPGQEVMARIHFRGHVNRFLMILDVDCAEAPASGTAVTNEGAEVGRITSAAVHPETGKAVALGYVRRDVYLGGGKLEVACGAGVAPAVARPLPYHNPG